MEVVVKIDGNEVPLNKDFVRDMVGKVVESALSVLHGFDESWEVIEVNIKR